MLGKLEKLFTIERTVDEDQTGATAKKTPNYRAIPDNIQYKVHYNVVLKDGNKKLNIKVSKTMHVTTILPTSPAVNLLKPGDLIMSVNGTKILTRVQFEDIVNTNTDGKFKFEVKRPKPPREILDEADIWKALPDSYDRLPGYKYLWGNICAYPGANLGIHIMSIGSKVYVTNAPQNTLAGEVYSIGDSILTVDKDPVTTVKNCSAQIKESLCNKGWCKTLVERPASVIAKRQAKAILKAEKSTEVDPKLTDDVQTICTEILTLMQKEPEKMNKEAKSVLRDSKNPPKPPTAHVVIAEKAEEVPIGTDPFNPELMQPVDAKPDPVLPKKEEQPKSSATRGKKKKKGFGLRSKEEKSMDQDGTIEN